MDLLEVTNHCFEAHRRIKERVVRDVCHDEDCTLATGIVAIRNGDPEASLTVADGLTSTGFEIAASTLDPEVLVVARDGISLVTGRRELCTIAVSRAGEIMWKIWPYEVVGTMLLSNGAEVPDQMPMVNPDAVADDMRRMMGAATAAPLNMSHYWPDEERARAEMDVVVAKGLESSPGHLEGIVLGVQLHAHAGTPRQEILLKSGLPMVLR